MANKISTVFEFSEKGNGLKRIRSDVQATDGAFGKMKVASKGAFDSIKQYGPEAALVVGTTLVTAAVKAGDEFAKAAVEVGRFSDATGLSTEEASKWASVADDLGINVEDVEKAFYRLNKEIGEGDGVAEEYGLTLKRTADGAADVNGTMLETIGIVSAIEDPTERARVAQELFGRSYANVAEIIFNDAEKVKLALDSTSDAQIFDEDEVKKAREYRAAMDEFNDVLVDLKYTIGEGVVPVLTDAASAAVDFKEAVESIPGVPKAVQLWWDNASPQAWIGHVASGWSAVGRAVGIVSDESEGLSDETHDLAADIGGMVGQLGAAEVAADLLAGATEHYAGWLRRNADEATYNADAHDEMGRIQRHVNKAVEAATKAQEDYLDSIKHTRDEVEHLIREISDEQSWVRMQMAIEDATAQMAELDEDSLEYKDTLASLRLEVLAYGESLNLPDAVLTMIDAEIDPNDMAYVNEWLLRLGNGVTLPIKPVVVGSASGQRVIVDPSGNARIGRTDGLGRGNVAGATGGIVTRPTYSLIGEAGPEAVIPLNRTPGSSPLPGGMGAGGNITINVVAPAGANADEFGRKVWEAIRREGRWRGPVGGIAA